MDLAINPIPAPPLLSLVVVVNDLAFLFGGGKSGFFYHDDLDISAQSQRKTRPNIRSLPPCAYGCDERPRAVSLILIWPRRLHFNISINSFVSWTVGLGKVYET